MKIINLLILLLAIPPAVLSSIQLMDTTLPVVSPIYRSIVKTVTDKVVQATNPQASEAPPTASASAAPGAPADTSPAADDTSLRPVHIGVAAVSIIVALAMLMGLMRRRANA